MGIVHCLGGERIQHIRCRNRRANRRSASVGVCVTLVGDSAVILKDTSTNGNGWFAINKVSLPEVFVGLSYMGYETQKIAVEHNGSDIDLGQLKLTPKSTMLNEVVVTAAQVVEEADKYVIIPSLKEI